MKYWIVWYVRGLVAIIALIGVFGSWIGRPWTQLGAGLLGGAWGFYWSRVLARRNREARR